MAGLKSIARNSEPLYSLKPSNVLRHSLPRGESPAKVERPGVRRKATRPDNPSITEPPLSREKTFGIN
jgi:hypothetical protein